MVQVIQEREKPLTGMKAFAAGLGSGVGEGISSSIQMGLQQKMQALQERRQIDQANQQREILAGQAEKQGFGHVGKLIRLGFGPEHIAKMAMEFPELLEPQSAETPQVGFNALGGLSQARRAPVSETNELIPLQDREAVEEAPAMAPVGLSAIKQASAITQIKEPTERKIKSLEDYAREIAPNYDKMGPSAKARIEARAEKRLNAEMKVQEAQEKKVEKQEKKQANFVKEIRVKSDAAKNILSAADNMAKIRERGNLGITSGIRDIFSPKTRADKAAYDTQASQFLSYYKALFPRGFTQQEFKHIEKNWLPNSSNTDERNQAIENSFREMASVLVQKSQLLDGLRDENGNLPPNAEQKVDQLMGKKIQELQNKFTNEVPPGGREEEEGFDELPSASQYAGREIMDEKTGSRFKSNGTKWVRVK